MKKLIILLITLVFTVVGLVIYGLYRHVYGTYHHHELYFNAHGIIVEMNGNTEAFVGKFHKPQNCKTVLIQDAVDTTLFVELSTCNYQYIVDTEWFYNHKVGDSVRFDYIRKDRYFRIQRK